MEDETGAVGKTGCWRVGREQAEVKGNYKPFARETLESLRMYF